MKLIFSLKNLDVFNKRMEKRLRNDALKEVKKNVTYGTNIVENFAKEKIQRSPATGNPRGDGSFASAPGEFPKTDTGFLVQNISSKVFTRGNTVIGQIISSAPYSKHLEFGTTKMAARPFMQPSLEANAKKIERRFKRGGYID